MNEIIKNIDIWFNIDKLNKTNNDKNTELDIDRFDNLNKTIINIDLKLDAKRLNQPTKLIRAMNYKNAKFNINELDITINIEKKIKIY